MKISYLITCSTETDTLERLLSLVGTYVRNDIEDEMVVVIDNDATDNDKTKNILSNLVVQMGPEYMEKRVKIFGNSLNNDYGTHKNYCNSKCTGDWIFQLDGDELPSETLLLNLKDIIAANPTAELFTVPRINDYRGVTPAHAMQWGWRLTPCPEYENRPIVNWPDYQGRIYKNIPSRIRWERKLHEKIEGVNEFVVLPAIVDLALYHDKTIETQMKTNIRYNQKFSVEENQGHTGFAK
jgi:glycosyltransferase involved in cell wall biosynthesis